MVPDDPFIFCEKFKNEFKKSHLIFFQVFCEISMVEFYRKLVEFSRQKIPKCIFFVKKKYQLFIFGAKIQGRFILLT